MSVSPTNGLGPVRYKVKVKLVYLTSVVTTVTKLVSMEADGAPFSFFLRICCLPLVFLESVR